MSMLAEPRRRIKWSVDPRNSAWSNDESKFGQKMLERMGWSKGKGLGRSEQGATDHIKVKVKNDSYGLGANASHEDNWIAHQDDFNDLLAQLNNCHGQNNTETQPEEQKCFSLEEKSKTSKKRVHYMKFAKGKDLSSRSAKDLNCIFGKRAKAATDAEQESSGDSHSNSGESCSADACPQVDTESVTKTVTSTLSMQEYFAQRMAHLKMGRAQSAAHESEEPLNKKKKTKRKAETPDDVEEASESSRKKKGQIDDAVNENSAEEKVREEQEPPKKKKKKKKTKKNIKKHEMEMLSETVALETKSLEDRDETLIVRKKSKKNKKKEQRF